MCMYVLAKPGNRGRFAFFFLAKLPRGNGVGWETRECIYMGQQRLCGCISVLLLYLVHTGREGNRRACELNCLLCFLVSVAVKLLMCFDNFVPTILAVGTQTTARGLVL